MPAWAIQTHAVMLEGCSEMQLGCGWEAPLGMPLTIRQGGLVFISVLSWAAC